MIIPPAVWTNKAPEKCFFFFYQVFVVWWWYQPWRSSSEKQPYRRRLKFRNNVFFSAVRCLVVVTGRSSSDRPRLKERCTCSCYLYRCACLTATVRVQRRFLSSYMYGVRCPISTPSHDFEGIRLDNPTNAVMPYSP